MGIARGGSPPLADVDLFRLKHNPAKPSDWTTLRVLGPGECYKIHFVPGRGGMPHLDGECPWCPVPAKKDPPRDLRYLPVYRLQGVRARRSVFELPEAVAAASVIPIGEVLQVIRKADGEYVWRRAEDPGLARSMRDCPIAAFDALTVLLRYWGLNVEDLEGGPVELPDVVKFPQRKQA